MLHRLLAKAIFLLFYHQLMHLTTYRYKSHQRWIAARGDGWPCIFAGTEITINFPNHSMSVVFCRACFTLRCVRALALRLRNWRCSCLAIFGCYSEVLVSAQLLMYQDCFSCILLSNARGSDP